MAGAAPPRVGRVPTCLLVRHGRTTANASGTLAGWTPSVELDDIGRGQVETLARRLADLPVRRLVSSPLTRCLQTSDLLRAGAWPDLAPEEHLDLGECRYGAWTGRSLRDLAGEPLWRVVQDQPSAARFPDGEQHPGESIAAMAARGIAAVREIDAQVGAEHGPDAVWVAVSHGDVIKAILADAAGAHLDEFQRFVVGPASVSAVRYTSRRPFLLRANDTGSDLAALVPPPAVEPTPGEGDGGSEAVVGGGA